MRSIQTSSKTPSIQEIVGMAAQSWGHVYIPTRGTITIKLVGDMLQATVKTGLEQKDSWTRIQNIDSIELTQAPIYALLALGGSLAFTGGAGLLGGLASLALAAIIMSLLLLAVGIFVIIYALQNKRSLLIIHSLRYTIPVFINKSPESYQQFAMNVMAIARQLNAYPKPVQSVKPSNGQSMPARSPQL